MTVINLRHRQTCIGTIKKPHQNKTVIPMRLYGNDSIWPSPLATLLQPLSTYIVVSGASVGLGKAVQLILPPMQE